MKPVMSVLFSQIVNSFLDSLLKANNCSVEPKRNKYRLLRVLSIASFLLCLRNIARKATVFSNLEPKEFLRAIFQDSQAFFCSAVDWKYHK